MSVPGIVAAEYLPRRNEWFSLGCGQRFCREASRAGMRVVVEVTRGRVGELEPRAIQLVGYAGSKKSVERLLRNLRAGEGKS